MRKPSARLPARLLAQIGRVATASASLEQSILIHTSALASRDTGGIPSEDLWMDFKRLRMRWYALVKKRADKKTLNTVLHPINTDLARLWPIRGYVVHGRWRRIAKDEYEVDWYEQKNSLRHQKRHFTLDSIKRLGDKFEALLARFHQYIDSALPLPLRQKSRARQRPTILPHDTKSGARRRPP